MLNFVGRGTAHTCDGTTRRDFLQVGSLGVAGLSLAGYLEAKEQGQVASGLVPYEMVTTYTAAQVGALQVAPYNDVMYIAHSGVHPRVLRRVLSNDWNITNPHSTVVIFPVVDPHPPGTHFPRA